MSASPLNEVAMFRLLGLDPAPFGPLFDLPDAQLHARGIRRVRADKDAGFPCRVSLRDAAAGEELLLLPYRHHDVDSPYQAEGPIYVRRRLISLRAYDDAALMVSAEVAEGADVASRLTAVFRDERVRYVHLHNARPGCYSCAAVRA
jgi:hypothetical protein